MNCVDYKTPSPRYVLIGLNQSTTDADVHQVQGVISDANSVDERCGAVIKERRNSTRFPIRCELQFKTSSKRYAIVTGTGRTVNMSSSGLLFESNSGPAVGTLIELAIEWPVALNEECLLRLIAKGRIVRQDNRQFAVKVLRYEFKTHAASKKSAIESDGASSMPPRSVLTT